MQRAVSQLQKDGLSIEGTQFLIVFATVSKLGHCCSPHNISGHFSGANMWAHSLRTVIAAWLNAFQRSQTGWNEHVCQEVKCRPTWAVQRITNVPYKNMPFLTLILSWKSAAKHDSVAVVERTPWSGGRWWCTSLTTTTNQLWRRNRSHRVTTVWHRHKTLIRECLDAFLYIAVACYVVSGFGHLLRCAHKRIVNIMEVYIGRNNIQVELI